MENKKPYGIIYKIKNKVNGKVYIGQTTEKRGFNGRYDCRGEGIERVYKYYKQKKKGINTHLMYSINKYGFDAFEVDEEFDVAYSKEELDMLEDKYIKEFNTVDRKCGYNKKFGGSNGKHSYETRKKISEKRMGIKFSETHLKKLSESHKGQKAWNKGLKHSEEFKKCFIGCHNVTDETRKKQSDARKGRFKGKDHAFAKQVICITTGEIFDSSRMAAEHYNISNHIIDNCKGRRKYCGKLPDGTPLVWRYYEEYLKEIA